MSDTEPSPSSRRQSMDDDRSEHSLGRSSSLKFVKAFRKKAKSDLVEVEPSRPVSTSAYTERILTPHQESGDGLVESLRQFTSVELLEGENAFACKKCWRNARAYGVREEDEEQTVPNGVSDSSDASDEEPPVIPVGRPIPNRRKSTHFVLRRAYKRYMIAKCPEVLVFHLKRFRQTQKGLAFTSFYDLKKWVV